MHFHRLAAPLFLLGFALPSIALTLGQPQGAAWVGRPLDVVIPISLGEGERQDALCAEAEVLQGTTRIEDKRVTVSVEPGARAGQLRLHVRSTVAVDEPVVQLTVRAGCEMNSTRQYVLLADMPADVGSVADAANAPRALPSSDWRADASGTGRGNVSSNIGSGQPASGAPASPAVRRVRPPAPQPAPIRNRDDDRAEGSRPAPGATPPRRAPAARPPAAATPRTAASAPASQRVANAAAPRPAASAATTGARLQLDALDPASVRNPALAASAPGITLPSGADAAIAAAALAASAAANAEELQRATQRMQALEATLAVLREQSTQNQRMLVEMRSELAEARDSRYRNPLVYVLVLLLLLALVALALLWRVARGTSRPAWWGDAPLKDDDGPAVRQPVAVAPVEPDSEPVLPAVATTFGARAAADSFNDAPDTVPPSQEDDGTPARYVNTEELFDVQQQSDFFVSLGQHDQAIAVLSEHIADNPETSALAYLDLLRIYHSLDRRDDYARVGREFERAFNAQVPVFEQFSEVGNGLEHYRSTLARIEAQWPQPATLGLIEELVFRKPGTRGDESFDLAAYRELLLLYSVAKEVIDPDSAPPTPVTPLSFLDTHDAALEPSRAAMVAPEGYLQDTQPDGLHDSMITVPGAALPSFYSGIDKGLAHDTVLGSGDTVLSGPTDVAPRDMADRGNEIEFDTTAFETVPGDLEAPVGAYEPAPPAVEALPDLDLFDPLTEAEIAPKPKRRN